MFPCRPAALALVALAAGGHAAPVPPPPKVIPFQYPTYRVAIWEYRSATTQRYRLVVQKAEEKDGAKVFHLLHDVYFCSSPGGSVEVSPARVTEGHGKTTRTLLVFPLRAGASWADGDRKATVAGTEVVRTQAGWYEAVRVDAAEPGPDGVVTETSWYASGVGLVKQVRAVGDGKPAVVAELEGFYHGPP